VPLYTFECTSGHMFLLPNSIDARDDPRQCRSCGLQLRRRVTSGLGLVRGVNKRKSGKRPRPRNEPAAPAPSSRIGPTFIDCKIGNCGTGMLLKGGHVNIDGLEITNTPTGFDLRNGATVNMKRVTYDSSPPAPAVKTANSEPPRRKGSGKSGGATSPLTG
jgi:hypothetical protein